MSNTTTITGNLTREPEIRYTKEGQATAQLGVAVNRRWQDRTTQEWQESTSFFDVICWRDLAENVALSLSKGMRVVVTGRLEQRSWETDEGEHRSKVEIVADEIGPCLRFATADVQRTRARQPTRNPPSQGRRGRLVLRPASRAGSPAPPVARPGAHGTGLRERHHHDNHPRRSGVGHHANTRRAANAPEGYELRRRRPGRPGRQPTTPCDRGRISRGPLLGPPRLASPDLGSRVVPQVPRRLRLRTLRARSEGGGQPGGNPKRQLERLIPPWQQPRLRRGCCASARTSWSAEVAPGHIRQLAAEEHKPAHPLSAPHRPTLTRPPALAPFTPFPPAARYDQFRLAVHRPPSDCFTRVAFEGGRARRRGVMMVRQLSVGCGTRSVPATGAGRDLATQDDLGVGLSLPDGVRRSG